MVSLVAEAIYRVSDLFMPDDRTYRVDKLSIVGQYIQQKISVHIETQAATRARSLWADC